MSDLLIILENEVQIAALTFLGVVYIMRLIWLFRFKSSAELTIPTGSAGKGVMVSMMNIGMPRAMESVRKHPFFYIQFH